MNPTSFPNPGYVPVRDSRDYSLEAAQPPIVRPALGPFIAPIDGLPILMQGQQPSCVAHGIVFAMMQKEQKRSGQVIELSRRFLYALSKQSDGIAGQGTSINNALNVAYKIGVCEERFFPDDISLPYEEYIDITKIPPEAYANAALHKIKEYRWVNDLSYAGLTNAIYQNDIVIMGVDIDKSWYTDETGNITWDPSKILPLRVPNPATSRHAVCLYTFNDDIELIGGVNSWSEYWGNKGTFFLYKEEIPYIYQAAVLFI